MIVERILALMVGGPVRAVITGVVLSAVVLSPLVLVLGWWGVGLIAVAVAGAAVLVSRHPWWGCPW